MTMGAAVTLVEVEEHEVERAVVGVAGGGCGRRRGPTGCSSSS